VPRESLLILEVEPAGYVVVAANECEKAVDVKLVHFDPVGRYGRLYVSGEDAAVRTAREVATRALEVITGVPAP